MTATLTVTENEIQEALARLATTGANLAPVYKQIGEYLVFSTRQRFKTSTAPDGTPWKENSELATVRFLSRTKGNFKKSGELSAKGRKRAQNKKPLVGESKSLSTQISYSTNSEGVEWGSPMIYAAVHQFGAKQGAFGRNKRNVPLPWGDIPARPFLGLSDDDRREIIAMVNDHIKMHMEGGI